MAVLDKAVSDFLDQIPGLALADTVTVRLHVQSEPYATNGQWDQTTQTVQWPKRGLDDEIPAMCFAFWSEPDIAFQTEHFGGVVLEKDDLGAFCLLYRAMAEREAVEWDKLIASIKPTEDLPELLRMFQVNSRAPDDFLRFLETIISEKLENSKSTQPPVEPN